MNIYVWGLDTRLLFIVRHALKWRTKNSDLFLVQTDNDGAGGESPNNQQQKHNTPNTSQQAPPLRHPAFSLWPLPDACSPASVIKTSATTCEELQYTHRPRASSVFTDGRKVHPSVSAPRFSQTLSALLALASFAAWYSRSCAAPSLSTRPPSRCILAVAGAPEPLANGMLKTIFWGEEGSGVILMP